MDSKDTFNGTGLIRAAERGHADIVGRLIQADVEVDHVNNLGWTALHEAIILGDGTPPLRRHGAGPGRRRRRRPAAVAAGQRRAPGARPQQGLAT